MSEERTPKPPTHLVKVKERSGSGRTTVGAAWLNDDGSMSVTLHPCVVLRWDDPVLITIFRKDERA